MKKKVESSKALKYLVLAVMTITLALTGCSPVPDSAVKSAGGGGGGGSSSGSGGTKVTITLPPVGSALRALSSAQVSRLQAETARYRVTANSFSRTGTGGTFTFAFAAGTKVDVTVECLNANNQPIVRSVTKSIVVTKAGDNSVVFVLSKDGTEVVSEAPPAQGPSPTPTPQPQPQPSTPGGGNDSPPAPPPPVTGKVTYDWGDANTHGTKGGDLPIDGNSYVVGETFTVEDGSGMTWEHADTSNGSGFKEWVTNVALEGDTGSNTQNVQAGDAVAVNGKYKMPAGGVTLTAQWNYKSYNILYTEATPAIGSQGSPQVKTQGATAFTMDSTAQDAALSEYTDSNGVYYFAGWATAQGAGTQNISGTAAIRAAVANGDLQIDANSNSVKLYAVWSNLPVYDVTLDDSQLKNMEYWKADGNANSTVKVIEGKSVTKQDIQSFLNGGAKTSDSRTTGYTLTYNGGDSGAIISNRSLTINAGDISWTTTYTVTVELSALQGETWWNTGDTLFTKSVAKDGQLLAQDIQAEINNRKKPNYNVTYTGGDKQVSSINNIDVAISADVLEVKEMFSITYNWGTGITPTSGSLPSQQTVESGKQATVTIPTGITRAGYNFLGWSETASQTSNPTYKTGSNTITSVTKNYTLYAVWQPTYSITYSWGNNVTDVTGASGTALTPPTAQSNIASGTSATVTIPTGVTRAGYNFLGWSETASQTSNPTYKTGSNTITSVTKNYTLYAVWQELFTVTYNSNDKTGGTVPTDTNQYTSGQTVQLNRTDRPTRTGYKFIGWNESTTDTVAATATYSTTTVAFNITKNITLSAVWQIDYTQASVGDIVFSDGTFASSAQTGKTAVGVVFYNGTKKQQNSLGGTAVIMVGLDEGNEAFYTGSGSPTNLDSGATTGTAVTASSTFTNVNGKDNLAKVQSSISNYPAMQWASQYSKIGFTSGWYLPSMAELASIYLSLSTVNSKLSAAGGTQFETNPGTMGTDSSYISSNTTNTSSSAIFLYFDDGKPTSSVLSTKKKNRAVYRLID